MSVLSNRDLRSSRSVAARLPQLFVDCPTGNLCGTWRRGIDVRICNRCGAEIPEVEFERLGLHVGRPG